MSNPVKPARTTLALTLRQVLSGRKEGHLQGSRILQVGFVGARHTSITSGDEHGRAFWWSLGKVIGVESNDVVRMLGSYPDKEVDIPPHPSKRPTTLFAVLPLPLGDTSHTTDEFQLSALLTSTKLVIVGMKPQAKTWFRKSRDNTGGEAGGLVGGTHWLRSGEVEDGSDASSDPVLAYSWGTAVRFVRVRAPTRESTDISLPKGVSRPTLTFVEGRKWEAPHPVQALFWFDQNVSVCRRAALMISISS